MLSPSHGDAHGSRQGSENSCSAQTCLTCLIWHFPDASGHQCFCGVPLLHGKKKCLKSSSGSQYGAEVIAPTWETDKVKFNPKSTRRAALGILLNHPQSVCHQRQADNIYFQGACVCVRGDNPCTEGSGTRKQFLKWDSFSLFSPLKNHMQRHLKTHSPFFKGS